MKTGAWPIFAGLCLIAIFAGCAAPGPRSRYIQQIEPYTLTNLVAFRYGTNLDLRIPLRGRAAFAHASWTPPEGITNYQHRAAVLTLEREPRAVRRSEISLIRAATAGAAARQSASARISRRIIPRSLGLSRPAERRRTR